MKMMVLAFLSGHMFSVYSGLALAGVPLNATVHNSQLEDSDVQLMSPHSLIGSLKLVKEKNQIGLLERDRGNLASRFQTPKTFYVRITRRICEKNPKDLRKHSV